MAGMNAAVELNRRTHNCKNEIQVILCVGVQRALDAWAEAIHLEEPEFWDRAGNPPNVFLVSPRGFA